MTKWDTIQADIADAYVYLDEEEMYEQALAEGAIELVDEYDEEEIAKSLTLDWND